MNLIKHISKCAKIGSSVQRETLCALGNLTMIGIAVLVSSGRNTNYTSCEVKSWIIADGASEYLVG